MYHPINDIERRLIALAGKAHLGCDFPTVFFLLSELDYGQVAVEAACQVQTELEEALSRAATDEGCRACAEALLKVLHDERQYGLNTVSPDRAETIDLPQLLLSKVGHPLALAALYISLGRGQGWKMAAVGPARALQVSIEVGDQTLYLDPYQQSIQDQPHDLGALWQVMTGLPGSRFEGSRPITDLQFIVYFLTAQKAVAMDVWNLERAEELVRRITLMLPAAYWPWMELGVLRWEAGELRGALDALRHCYGLSSDKALRKAIAEDLTELNNRLN